MIILRNRLYSKKKFTHKYRGIVSGGFIDRNDNAHPDEEISSKIAINCKKKYPRSRKNQEDCIGDSIMEDRNIEDDVKAVTIADSLQKLRNLK